VGSTLARGGTKLVENFVSEKPAKYYAEMYKSDELAGGHVIMLDTLESTKREAGEALKVYPREMQIGGGINDANASEWLDKGAARVIVTSFVFKGGKVNLKNLDILSALVGRKKLVIDLSCRKKEGKYFVVTDKWQKFTEYELNKENIELLQDKCAEFLVHAVDVEGKCNGVQEEVIELLAKYSNIPVTYAGGISSMSDIEKVKEKGRGKIDFTIGTALDIFGGKLEYKKVLERMK
jgi:phosphoribosylformimino-5-aminoimidazole carboxamide ribotide isomerase